MMLNRNYNSNRNHILALEQRINSLMKMNDDLLRELKSSRLLTSQKKQLSHQILSFIQKFDKLHTSEKKYNYTSLIQKYSKIESKFVNLEDKIAKKTKKNNI